MTNRLWTQLAMAARMSHLGKKRLRQLISTSLSKSSASTAYIGPNVLDVSGSSASTSTSPDAASAVSATSGSAAGIAGSTTTSSTAQTGTERTATVLIAGLALLASLKTEDATVFPQLMALIEARKNLVRLDTLMRLRIDGEPVDELEMKRLRNSIQAFVDTMSHD